MDQDVAFYEMFWHMRDGEHAEARENALALKEWLGKGGFYPWQYTQIAVDAYLADVLRRTAYLEYKGE